VSPLDCRIFACKILKMALTKEELHVLGYFTKLHGYKGELTATFEAVSQGDYTDLESIFLEVKGQLIPYFIESIEHKTNTSVKIKLEGVDSEEAARAFVKLFTSNKTWCLIGMWNNRNCAALKVMR
jgi:ribosomal 30S subunit maturation factor RimM